MRLILLVLLMHLTGCARKTARTVSNSSEWKYTRIEEAPTTPTKPAPKPGTTVTKTPNIPRNTTSTEAISKTENSAPVSSTSTSSTKPATSKPAETKTTARAKPANASTTFTELFTNNSKGWLVGKRNGYEFEITDSSYYIRKLRPNLNRPARCYITLPSQLTTLNKAEAFTITVDMVVPNDVAIESGLLFGLRDTLSYNQFQISKQQIILKRLSNGGTFVSYMPGKPIPAKNLIHPQRNTLKIEKRDDKLHFFINEKEVPSSPYEFRTFAGNRIGFITASQAVKFQNLRVQIKPAS